MQKFIACLLGFAWIAGCRADVDPPDVTAMVKVPPAGVSTSEAWALFDRSTSSVYTPDEKPVVVELDRETAISALKVYGPAPYKLEVHGFDPIDLSTLDRGWHVIAATTSVPTKKVELAFHALGPTGGVPEIELWSQVQHLPDARGSVDLTGSDLPSQYVRLAATTPADELSPGNCVAFDIGLSRTPHEFRATHVVYDAKGVFRAFSLTRTVNDLGEQGGSWLAGNNDATTIVDEFDPENLRVGDNTVRLCEPASATQRVTVSNLRIIGELDDGTGLVSAVAVGGRNDVALLDADANTTLEVGAHEHLILSFEHLVAVDALALSGSELDPPEVSCVVSAAVTRSLTSHYQKTDEGALIGFGDAAMSCSALDLVFAKSVTLSAADVLGSGAAERVDWPRIIVTNTLEHFGTTAWVGGFVARPSTMSGAVRIDVGGQPMVGKTGDFGQLLARAQTSPTWPVTVRAHLPDGTTQERQLILDRDRRAQLDQAEKAIATADTLVRPDTRFGRVGDVVQVKAATGAPSKIRLGSAVGLDVPAGALRAPTTISVRHMSQTDLPPLEPGMVNVTAPKDRGYEFLPHGQRFAKPIEVLVPFDPALIPDEMTPEDIHTFYFDPADKKWKQLARMGLDVGEHVAHSATDHFTIMIDAVLATPKNPTPLSFDPTAMSSIVASPTDNMDLIAPPEANATGDANVALPIRVPPGRGAYTPSLAIAYSSAASNGWLGVGWDLAVSHVAIDTRWGVPTYDQEQRYVVDGTELIPTIESDGPLCQNGTRGQRYRPRVEGGFAHIAKCESGAGLHFEIHDRNGTLFVYGDDPAIDPPLDPRHADLADPTDATHIARWNLSKVVDVHGNTTIFHYAVDNVPTTEPGREVYPSSIAYTSGGATTAAYKIDFQLDDSARPDVITSGRSGFKTATRHLLRAVHVSYRGQIIRDYVLTYTHGEFQKTTLANVRVYGAGGCATGDNAFTAPTCSTTNFFHQHSFDYFRETEAFSPSTHLLMGGTDDAQKMPLTTAATSTRTGGVSESIAITPGLSVSFGGSVQTNYRKEELGLYDIDGDGLPDQVYIDGDHLTALYNQSAPGVDPTTHVAFAADPTRSIVGLNVLGSENGGNWGLSAGGSYGLSLDGSYSNSNSSATRRMVDVDGDGFVDSLGGRSFFGRPCSAGTCFSEASYGAVNGINPFADPALQQLATDVGQRLMLAQPVVQWTAPMAGHVNLSGIARKRAVGGTDLLVEIYQDDDFVESIPITAFDVLAHSVPAAHLPIEAGHTISVRVIGGGDDATDATGAPLDQVDVDLHVVYADTVSDGTVTYPSRTDSTGSSVYSYASAADFRMAGTPTFIVSPVKGTLELHAILHKDVTAADVRACLQRFTAPDAGDELDLDVPCSDTTHALTGTWLMPATFALDQPLDMLPSNAVNVNAGDIVMLRVESDFSFDPNALTISQEPGVPYLAYTQVCIADAAIHDEVCSTAAGDVAAISLPTRAVSDFGPYIALMPAATKGLVAATAKTATFGTFDAGHSYVRVTSDRQGIVYTQDCVLGGCSVTLPPIAMAAGEVVYIELSSASALGTISVPVTYNDSTSDSAPVTTHVFGDTATVGRTPFAGGFHGWRHGMWNSDRAFKPATLITRYQNWSALTTTEMIDVAQTAIAPVASFGHHVSVGNVPAWVGPGSIAFVAAGTLSGGHLGLVGDGGSGAASGGIFTSGYSRMSTTISKTLGGGTSLTDGSSVFSVGLSVGMGQSDTVTSQEMMDFDGDGIIDVLGASGLTLGALDVAPDGRRNYPGWGPQQLRLHHGFDYSISLDAGAMKPVVSSHGRALFMSNEDTGSLGLGVHDGYTWGIGRSETVNDLVDVNGDGLPDVILRDGANIKVRLNLGGRLGQPEPFGAVDAALLPNSMPIDSFQNKEGASAWAGLVGLAGFTPDTTSDALDHDTTITEQHKESADFFFYSSVKTTTLTTTRTTRTVADLNGDGLPDLIVKVEHLPTGAPAPFFVQYNYGSSFGPPVAWTTPPWDVTLAPTFRPGVLLFQPTGPDVIAATGNGDQSVSNGSALSIPIPYTPFTIGGNWASSTIRDTYELALMDIDGDGAPDHVLRRKTVGGTPTMYVKYNQITGRANLLKSVTRPIGGSFTLDYTPVGNTIDMPHRRQVLSRLEVDDGVDLGAAFPSPNLVTTFAYDHGVFSRNEKEFFGFSKVTTTRADGVTLESDYANDAHQYALHGKLLHEIKRDAATNVLHQHDITYQILDVLDATNAPVAAISACSLYLPALLSREPAPCTPTFPVVTQDSETRVEGAASKTRIKTDAAADHDRFGNVLASTDGGDPAITSDDIYSRATYSNDTSHWILGRPTSIEVHAGSAAGTLLRSRTGEFTPTGDLSALHVDTGTGVATSTFGYDAYGNLNHVTSPPNEAAQTQTFDVTYDADTRMFPIQTKDGFGYTSTATYDARFGAAVTQTDVNNQTVLRTLDAFGRVTQTRSPYDSTSTGIISVYATSTVPASVATAVVPSIPPASGAPVPGGTATAIFVDGFGRVVEQRKSAVVNGTNGIVTAGIVGRDGVGRVTKTQNPFFTASPAIGFVTPVATLATTTGYDSLDRPTSTLYPDGTSESLAYAIAAAPSGPALFRLNATDANGHVHESFVDFNGRVRARVGHPTTATSSITTYDYLATGELTQIVDADHNTSSLNYDRRGLRTSMTNPDTGLIETGYDLMGNRISLTEPNHRAASTFIHYKYDRDRLRIIDYPAKPDVAYTYGAVAAANNGADRVVAITDETGTQTFEYGALGELRRTTRSVIDTTVSPSVTTQFDTHTTFDSVGRLLQTTYPDGETVTNTYNFGGMLSQVDGAGNGWTRNYVSALRYDVFGNRTHAQFGNKDVSDWTFDPARVRLSSLVTTLAGTSTKIQDLHYLYDAVGNPQHINNTLPATPVTNALPGTTNQDFVYDGVDRLVDALGNGTVASGSTKYEMNFAYGASDQILTKSSSHRIDTSGTTFPPASNYSSTYKYTAGFPHLPSLVGSLEITYDKSGNPTKRKDGSVTENLIWDDDNRLIQVSGIAKQYNLYDASGSRVVRNGNSHTIFASQLYEFDTHATGTKHIFAGAERVASVVSGFASGIGPVPPTAKGTPYYIHQNHLGSTGVVTNNNKVNDAHEYFPDGAAWIDSGVSTSIDGHLFSGKPFDTDTGFYDFGQRFYDPRLSLWMGVDPALKNDPSVTVGSPFYLAASGYVGNRPLAMIDPDGRQGFGIDVGKAVGVDPIARHVDTDWHENWTNPEQYARGTLMAACVIGGAMLVVAAPEIGFEVGELATTLGASPGTAAMLEGAATNVVSTIGVNTMQFKQTSGNELAAAAGEGAVFGLVAHGLEMPSLEPSLPTELPPRVKAYLSKSGGRPGGTPVRQQNHGIATALENGRGVVPGKWKIVGGAGRASEEYIPGPGGAKKGATWVDITATQGARRIRIQTVDTNASGQMTPREFDAAMRIRANFPNEELIIIRKTDGARIPF